VDDLVKRRSEGYLCGRNRSAAGVCGLEDPRVEHNLSLAARRLRAQANDEVLFAGDGAGESGDGGGDPLIARNDRLNHPIFGWEDLAEY
jgi:hypothetical protein